MDRSAKAALWIIATGVITAGLWWFRDWLTQFALALFLWLAIDGLAEWLDKRVPYTPRWLALPVAIVLVLTVVAVVGVVVTQNVADIAGRFAEQGARLNALAAQVWSTLGLAGSPPTLSGVLEHADPATLLRTIGAGLQGVVGDALFILIYLGFLFAAAAQFPRKLDRLYPRSDDRERVNLVLGEIRTSMKKYIWVQTIMSVIITALTLVTLLAIGLPNALFWAFLVFFLNYIPTIGSFIAVLLPTLAAVVEFDSLSQIAMVAGGMAFWQFAIGNFVQPRLTGDSLNLSAVVVLLALALWGALWGIAGAFLAAPLTTALMSVLAQGKDTRWIAILLSADGKPKRFRKREPAPENVSESR